MDYAASAQQVLGANAKTVPELGRLKAAADRISSAARQVDSFIARFHGATPESAAKDPPTNDCYRNDLDAVFSALEALESRVSALSNIG